MKSPRATRLVILCRSQSEAESALSVVRQWVSDAGLTLHPEKTHIVDSRVESFSFHGYSFRDRFRFPRAKSHRKVVDRIRELTPRSSGESLTVVIARLNSMLRGWFSNFRHCFWNVFGAYDGMIRRRLRRILLKRHRTNPERLPRQRRWPNHYFSELGLFSLREAHTRFVQSTGTS
jgi:RNA-directed DNA polymerase